MVSAFLTSLGPVTVQRERTAPAGDKFCRRYRSAMKSYAFLENDMKTELLIWALECC